MATRLREAGRGTLIPLALAKDPSELYPALRAAARNTVFTTGEAV